MHRIDSHQHFWQFNPIRDAWIDDSMTVLQRDFMPENLQPLLGKHNIDGCVAVQADQSENETDFLLNLGNSYSFIKGVVGWVDLLANDLSQRLDHFSQNPLFKGVRHIAQSEADDYLIRSDVQRGISQLVSFGLTYDILIYAHQLPAAIRLVSRFPEQKFILDHIAKPNISKGVQQEWKKNLQRLAQHSNVYCKISGMVTETDNMQWTKEDFIPYFDVVIEAFGIDRILYGSDWPVCLLAAQYAEQIGILEDYLGVLTQQEQDSIMGGNAIQFYNLSFANISKTA